MEGLVIAFSGRIASGKSTLSREVALALCLRRVSFGDCVRTLAQNNGLLDTRKNLQVLGESLVSSDPVAFTRSVLATANFRSGESLVVDGIRHLQVLRALRVICAPSVVRLVLLDVDDEVRRVRQVLRGIQDGVAGADAHSTEVQVSEVLKSEADVLLDGSLPILDLVAIVTKRALTDWARA